jgi:succinyl-CoA synthetase beta subunit
VNLHEHQAKSLLSGFGVPVPTGVVATTAAEARQAAEQLGGERWVVKAQIHAGQRAAAGGVRLVGSPDDAASAAAELIGRKIVTGQTMREGLLVRKVYVEQACEVEREIYAALLVNRSMARIELVASPQGRATAEAVLADRESLIALPLGEAGLDAADAARLAEGLSLSPAQGDALASLIAGARRAFVETDASLIEFNPIAITTGGDVMVLDVKMTLDDNALGRHPELRELRDQDEIDPQEREADRYEHNYARMEGDIGLMTTGAGLGLALIDLIKEEGGEPANFMDTRPMASREQIAEGIHLLLRDKRVKVLLVVAIGGCILHCDTIAECVATAFRQAEGTLPVVFHAVGTGKEISEMTLRNQGVPAIFADSLEEAAHEAVRIAASGGD